MDTALNPLIGLLRKKVGSFGKNIEDSYQIELSKSLPMGGSLVGI